MSTTTTSSTRPAPLDGRSAADVLAIATVVLAPLGIVLGNALHPVVAGSEPADLLRAVSEDPGRWIFAKLVYAAGSLLLVPAMAAVLSLRRGGLVLVGATLAGLGAACNALSQALLGYTVYTSASLGLPDGPTEQLVRGFDELGLVGLPVSFASIPVLVVGLLVLAIGVLRSGTAPRSVGALLVVGVLASAAVQAGPIALVAGAPLVAAFVGLARTIWRSRTVAPGGVAAG